MSDMISSQGSFSENKILELEKKVNDIGNTLQSFQSSTAYPSRRKVQSKISVLLILIFSIFISFWFVFISITYVQASLNGEISFIEKLYANISLFGKETTPTINVSSAPSTVHIMDEKKFIVAAYTSSASTNLWTTNKYKKQYCILNPSLHYKAIIKDTKGLHVIEAGGSLCLDDMSRYSCVGVNCVIK